MKTMAQWLGYMVSIKCAENVCYQGQINTATASTISLVKAFRNGIPCPQNEVAIRASDILELKLIDKQSNTLTQSTVTIAKPVPKKALRVQDVPNTSRHSVGPQTKSKPIEIDPKLAANLTPNKNRKSRAKSWKDEECFGSLDSKIDKEFDFEKNLALFDKQAIWDELNSQKPDVLRHLDKNKPGKYRHDENVIASAPATYRQIIVPKQDFCEYVTDDGLIIPSVSRALRNRIFEIAERVGIVWERRVELLGRAATEISIQLLGGGHRLNPRNSHQVPTVVFLCGAHKQGATGINTARQLASHGVRTFVQVPPSEVGAIKKELALYNLTKGSVHNTTATLPNLVDLIIIALGEDTDSLKCPQETVDWVQRHNKTPVLALDPPSGGILGITPKFSLLPVLPLPHSAKSGKLYLCNLGFPIEVFTEAGITYKPPFGPKFVIPLHPKDY